MSSPGWSSSRGRTRGHWGWSGSSWGRRCPRVERLARPTLGGRAESPARRVTRCQVQGRRSSPGVPGGFPAAASWTGVAGSVAAPAPPRRQLARCPPTLGRKTLVSQWTQPPLQVWWVVMYYNKQGLLTVYQEATHQDWQTKILHIP